MENTSSKSLVIAGVIVLAVGIFLVGMYYDRWIPSDDTGEQIPTEDYGGVLEDSETYSAIVPQEVKLTAPQVEAPAAPGAASSLRIFEMTISEKGYAPNEIVVNLGDTVNIKAVAQGGDYDIELPDLGLYHLVQDGEEKVLGFQALLRGTYTFLCRDQCPKAGVIKGTFIVK